MGNLYPYINITVDDGTGVIECIYRNDENRIPKEREGMKKISKVLLKHAKDIATAGRDALVGNTVKIRGCVAEYKKKRKVLINRLIPIMDKNEELFSLYEKLALYRDEYGIQQ